ncbi:Lrp/AsnC family transcriptional regulator [archaeon]|jgi:Lrp/AsnC family transcriptional regulator, leucine-responsive regulatory protein|nr:Lrp/AsnC family transcriptional regulator [archaeon]
MVVKLDLKDKKILYELDKNSRANLKEISKKVRVSKEVVFHRINRLVNENVIVKFLTVPATYRLGLTGYKVYLRLANTSKKDLKKIIGHLQKEKSVYHTSVCKGRWDLIFGIWAKSNQDFFTVYNIMLDKFSKYIQEKELSITVENIQFNRRWFYNDNLTPEEFTFGENEEKIKINKEDKKILDLITLNSRMKLVDISEKINLSPKVVAYRIKEMEKKKIIRGYKIFLNPQTIKFNTYKSFVHFKNINEERKKEFINYCKNLPNIINMVTTFASWDMEMMFETQKDEEYYKIMDDIKEEFNDIIKFYESVLMISEPTHKYLVNAI